MADRPARDRDDRPQRRLGRPPGGAVRVPDRPRAGRGRGGRRRLGRRVRGRRRHQRSVHRQRPRRERGGGHRRRRLPGGPRRARRAGRARRGDGGRRGGADHHVARRGHPAHGRGPARAGGHRGRDHLRPERPHEGDARAAGAGQELRLRARQLQRLGGRRRRPPVPRRRRPARDPVVDHRRRPHAGPGGDVLLRRRRPNPRGRPVHDEGLLPGRGGLPGGRPGTRRRRADAGGHAVPVDRRRLRGASPGGPGRLRAPRPRLRPRPPLHGADGHAGLPGAARRERHRAHAGLRVRRRRVVGLQPGLPPRPRQVLRDAGRAEGVRGRGPRARHGRHPRRGLQPRDGAEPARPPLQPGHVRAADRGKPVGERGGAPPLQRVQRPRPHEPAHAALARQGQPLLGRRVPRRRLPLRPDRRVLPDAADRRLLPELLHVQPGAHPDLGANDGRDLGDEPGHLRHPGAPRRERPRVARAGRAPGRGGRSAGADPVAQHGAPVQPERPGLPGVDRLPERAHRDLHAAVGGRGCRSPMRSLTWRATTSSG